MPLSSLPADWRLRETLTQERGDGWYAALATPLLRVPSAIVPLDACSDLNVLVNHRHPDSAGIACIAAEPFLLDTSLF